MAAEDDGAILGVHLAAGVLWFGLVSQDGGHVEDRTDRLTLEDGRLGEPRALAELEESVEALLRRLRPSAVGLLNAGTSKQAPKPTVSRRRGHLEAVVLMAAERTSTGVVRVTQDSVKKAFGGTPASKEARDAIAAELGIEPLPNWDNRAPAYATALVVAGEGKGSDA
jgi:Holliday junction resolvasome RuvABC endonuclease subunit